MQNDYYRFDGTFSIATVTFRLAFNPQFVHTFPMYPTKQSIRFPFRQFARSVYLASETVCILCGHSTYTSIAHYAHGSQYCAVHCTMNVNFKFRMRAAL